MHHRTMRGRSFLAALASILAMPLAAQIPQTPAIGQVKSDVLHHGQQLIAQPGMQAPSTQIPRVLLTLDQTLSYFRQRGFDLAIASSAVAAADADIVSASAITNPSIALSRGRSSTYDPAQCAGCSSQSIGAGISDQGALSDLATGKRRLRVAVAFAARDAAKSSRADVERTLELTVKQQLLLAELSKRALDYVKENQKIANDIRGIAGKRYEAGAVSEADVARADVQKLEADQSFDLAMQSFAAAKAGLAYLLGFAEGSSEIDVSDDLLRIETLHVPGATEDEMLRQALQRRPDLLQTSSQIARARSSLDLARRLVIPDVLPSLNYSAEGRGQSAIQPPTITFGVAATLPAFNRYRGEIARAEADLHTQQLTRQKVQAQIGSDVSSAIAAFQSAGKRASRMNTSLLGQAARARDLVRLQYEKGAVSLFEYLDAQRSWLATRTEYLQTISDYWTAVFQLEAATATEIHS